MRVLKCRKSVFCVQLLFFFAVGTICGILVFRWLVNSNSGWIRPYCLELLQSFENKIWTFLLSSLRPLLLICLLATFSWGPRLFPAFFFVRGFLASYCSSAFLTCGVLPGILLLRDVILISALYTISCWSWIYWTGGSFSE